MRFLSATWGCLALSAAVLAVFGRIVCNDFIEFDDLAYIAGNVHVTGGFTPENLRWALTSDYLGNWHPLTWGMHMLDYRLFGADASGHHATSLFLHLANTLLLFLLLFRLTGRFWPSLAAGALFGVHPMHVESVAWASEKKDLLSGWFGLLSLWAYARYAERPRLSAYLLVTGVFVLGLMCKPMLVTLPLMFLLMDFWPLNRVTGGSNGDGTWRSNVLALLKEKIPWFLLSMALSAAAYGFQGSQGAMSRIPVAERLAHAVEGYAAYILKLFWPMDLAVLYPYVSGVAWGRLGLSLVLLAGITVWVLRNCGRRPWLGFGWLWFLGTLIPVIGLVKIGPQSIADRYTYLPYIGLFVLLCWETAEAVENRFSSGQRRGLAVLGACGLALLMALSFQQAGRWKDSATLFGHALRVTSGNYILHNYLGNALYRQGKAEEAAVHFRRAAEINPYYAEAHHNLGGYLYAAGKLKEAEAEFRTALILKPGYLPSREYLDKIYAEWKAPSLPPRAGQNP
ncbi:MAG: hypothetical protein COV67_14540 [Nitrospinae bacterium CG11_big_fil_rev_8_21_14_0_20_56_8]|nr:MAG: hypothetical protein COV67_14540 [Nitrospinae bacterium CG11_big_fil_rev_8_21_14_0_20_56_8]